MAQSSPSDSQLAQRYCAGVHGQNTAFFHGSWRRYSSGVWKPLHKYRMADEILHVLDSAEGVRSTHNKVRSVEGLLRGKLFVADEMIDANPDLINLKNGVYDTNLPDEGIKPHKPEYYMVTQLPFEYDANAEAPLWEMYLESTFVRPFQITTKPVVDHKLITFVQEAIGYSLTTDIRYHVTFWALGEGANGKGCLFHIISALAGDSAIALNLGLLGREQYQLAQLAGKKVALCSESQRKNLIQDDLVKSLVGGDPMNVRMIRQEPFTLNPVCKLWLSANNLPIVTDTSEGMWRRIQAIPFNRKFYDRRRAIDDRVLDLKERLESELPGIFLWAMEGLKSLRDRGKFEPPPQVVALTDDYRFSSNHTDMFVEESCITVVGSTDSTLALIYSSYSSWAKENGFKRMSRTTLKAELSRLGYPVQMSGKTAKVMGLRLKAVTPSGGNQP